MGESGEEAGSRRDENPLAALQEVVQADARERIRLRKALKRHLEVLQEAIRIVDERESSGTLSNTPEDT